MFGSTRILSEQKQMRDREREREREREGEKKKEVLLIRMMRYQ